MDKYLLFIQETKNYIVKSSGIHGKGVFATIEFPRTGVNLGVAFTKIKNTGVPDKDYKRTDLGIYVNHSKTPNIRLTKTRNKYYYITTKKVKKGQEFFIDYHKFPWEGKRTF